MLPALLFASQLVAGAHGGVQYTTALGDKPVGAGQLRGGVELASRGAHSMAGFGLDFATTPRTFFAVLGCGACGTQLGVRAFAGPALSVFGAVRLDLQAELGMHFYRGVHRDLTVAGIGYRSDDAYSNTPFLGFRPQLLLTPFRAAVGLAAVIRTDLVTRTRRVTEHVTQGQDRPLTLSIGGLSLGAELTVAWDL